MTHSYLYGRRLMSVMMSWRSYNNGGAKPSISRPLITLPQPSHLLNLRTMASSASIDREYTVYRSKDGAIIGTNTRIPPLGPRDVLIRITHSGVCNADAMYASMGAPIALGHEGVGIVEEVGSEVTQLSPGDRAGGGYHRGSCGTCRYCLSGQDIYCDQRVIFGSGEPDNGTFAQYYIGKETYVHKIPELISSAHATPLQCAGAATYVALKSTISPTSRVGVIGIGGLGHLAIQFAAHLGGEVVALSTTREKQEEALELGAREFVLMEQLPLKRSLDVLIVTSSHYPDWEK